MVRSPLARAPAWRGRLVGGRTHPADQQRSPPPGADRGPRRRGGGPARAAPVGLVEQLLAAGRPTGRASAEARHAALVPPRATAGRPPGRTVPGLVGLVAAPRRRGVH